MINPCIGAEYYIFDNFSVGGESQIEIVFFDKSNDNLVSTKSMITLRFYL